MPMQKTDVEPVLHGLFLQGLDGDALAYHDFLQRVAGYLRTFIRRRLFNWPDEIEDLVQECLLAMHIQRHTFQRDQPMTAWIGAIARYKVVDLLRAKSARELRNVPIDEWEMFAESGDGPDEAKRDVAVLLNMLPSRTRLAIVLVQLQGLSVAEAAKHIGISEAAVKVGIHRGIRTLAASVTDAACRG